MTVLTHVALVQRTKKQDFVLRVIKELHDRGIEVFGAFAGEVREEGFLKEIQQLAETLGIAENIKILGRCNDIPDLLALSDVIIIPSSFEGFPLAGLEAASAGTPVLACDVAGAKEFVEVSKAGKVFCFDNVKSAADGFCEILQNQQELLENGKLFARECQLNVDKHKIKAMFKSVL